MGLRRGFPVRYSIADDDDSLAERSRSRVLSPTLWYLEAPSLMGHYRHRRPDLAECLLLTHLRHWLCTAAIVLMPVSAPIEVLV